MSSFENFSLPTTNSTAGYRSRWVVYREVGDVLIFASVDIAIHLHTIYRALHESRTWGEFRRLLPAGEWPDIEQRLFLAEDEVEDEDRSHWEDDEAAFMPERVQGLDESAYPLVGSAWLGDVEAFPNALIKAYNEMLVSPNGAVLWQIPVECSERVAATLREWGYFVEQADFLEFC